MKKTAIIICVAIILILVSSIIPLGACKAEPSKISIVTMSGPYTDAVRMLIPEFETANNIKIEVIDLPYDGMFEKQLTELKAKTGRYDAVWLCYQWLGGYVDYLEPLDDYAKKNNTNLNDYPKQGLMENGEWEGKLYALPMPLETMMLFYRKDLITNPPKTYEEALELGKQLTKPDQDFYGFAVMGAKEQAMTVYTDILWGMGGKLFDENMKPAFNDEVGLNAMNTLLEMFKYSPPESVSYAIPEATADFLSGRVAMLEQWPSCVTFQAEDPEQSQIVGKVGYAPIPGGHGHFGGMGITIAQSSKNKDMTYKLIAYLTSKEKALEVMEKTGVYPSQSSILMDSEVNEKYPFMEAFNEALEGTIGRPKIPESTHLCDIMDMRVSQIIIGELSPEEGLAKIAEEWEKILDEAGYYK